MDMFPDTSIIRDVQQELDSIIQQGVINITKLIRASETKSDGVAALPDDDIQTKKKEGKKGETTSILLYNVKGGRGEWWEKGAVMCW